MVAWVLGRWVAVLRASRGRTGPAGVDRSYHYYSSNKTTSIILRIGAKSKNTLPTSQLATYVAVTCPAHVDSHAVVVLEEEAVLLDKVPVEVASWGVDTYARNNRKEQGIEKGKTREQKKKQEKTNEVRKDVQQREEQKRDRRATTLVAVKGGTATALHTKNSSCSV